MKMFRVSLIWIEYKVEICNVAQLLEKKYSAFQMLAQQNNYCCSNLMSYVNGLIENSINIKLIEKLSINLHFNVMRSTPSLQ